MLMVYASLMATYVVFMICSCFLNVEYLKNSKRTLPIHLLGLSICFGVLQIPMIRFLKKNDIFHGGRNGFYQDTMTYLIENVMHNIALSDMQTFFLKIIFCLPVLLSALVICFSIIKQKKAFFKKHLSLIILTFLCIALPIEMTFQHMILGSPYPIERFSIFLIPILFLQWSFYCNYLFTTQWKNIGMSIFILLAFLSTSHFIYRADLYTCAEWHYDKETKNMLHTLQASLTNEQKLKKHQIGLHWHFEPTTNFYRIQMNLQSWLQPCNRDGYLITDSFYYIYKEEIKDIPTTEFKIIKEFDSVGTVLIENLQVEDWRKQNNN